MLLLENDGFFFPAYVGKHGWIGMWTDDVPWAFVEELVEHSYRLIAMKRQIKLLDQARETRAAGPRPAPRKHA